MRVVFILFISFITMFALICKDSNKRARYIKFTLNISKRVQAIFEVSLKDKNLYKLNNERVFLH